MRDVSSALNLNLLKIISLHKILKINHANIEIDKIIILIIKQFS